MIIGEAIRYVGGRVAIQTVYWRASGNGEKLVKTGKNFSLKKPELVHHEAVKPFYAEKITDNKMCIKSMP